MPPRPGCLAAEHGGGEEKHAREEKHEGDHHARDRIAKESKAPVQTAQGPDDRSAKEAHREDQQRKRRQFTPGNRLAWVGAKSRDHLHRGSDEGDQAQAHATNQAESPPGDAFPRNRPWD